MLHMFGAVLAWSAACLRTPRMVYGCHAMRRNLSRLFIVSASSHMAPMVRAEEREQRNAYTMMEIYCLVVLTLGPNVRRNTSEVGRRSILLLHSMTIHELPVRNSRK
ncbi:hypothetical protein DL93DRAFT_1981499 [Clavulina sp. PMI_390]|nr:hypothetical protein DL93DRAFT_1981499 [Clavulina sp. PMI_390]